MNFLIEQIKYYTGYYYLELEFILFAVLFIVLLLLDIYFMYKISKEQYSQKLSKDIASLFNNLTTVVRNFFNRLQHLIFHEEYSPTDKTELIKRKFLISFFILFFSNLTFFSVALYESYRIFYTQPYLQYEYLYPEEKQTWSVIEKPIEMTFTAPIRKDNLEFNITPDVEGKLEFVPMSKQIPVFKNLYRRVRFYPKETIKPGELIVTYVVGISPTQVEQNHEYSAKLYYPEATIEESRISPKDESKDVLTGKSIVFPFDQRIPIDTMYEVEVITRPEFDYVLAKNPNQVVVTPNELLSQDTIYEVELKLIPKTFVFKTQEKKDGKYQTTKFRTKFATVKTPNIKKFSPKGTTVLVNKPIILEFNTAMDLDTVKDNFVIKPQTEGSFETPDNHTLRFIPKNPLPKETNFEVKVNKGFQNIAGGISDQELSFKFRTIGEIRVLDTFPENNDNYVNVNTNQIRIQFDQKVDKESAQSKFSISPSLDGSFEWKDNTMIYNLSQDLAYQTRYTVSLRKGVKSINGIDLKNNYSFQFVSRSNITLIDVPWHAQTENFTCNVQATAMVLDYYGNYFGEQEMKQKIGVQPALNKNTWTGGNPYEGWVENYGVYWTRVSEVISEYRTNEVKRNWNVQGLTTAVENGNPSILWWYNDYSKPKEWFSWETPDGTVVQGLNGMHSEVVVGFEGPADNPTHIYTNDPWRGKNRRYTIATFKDLWSNFNNTAVVVY